MKKLISWLLVILMSCFFIINISGQKLRSFEYTGVGMRMEGILDLKISNDTRVDFSFVNISDFIRGITIYNAVELEVDATIAWDLFVYANSDNWILIDEYSDNGNYYLPAEILEVKSSVDNSSSGGYNLNNFTSLKGLTNSEVEAGKPSIETQFLMGMINSGVEGEVNAGVPGTALGNPDTHRFSIHYRLVPGIDSSFPNSNIRLSANGNNEEYAKAGNYYIDVIYSLVEDL